MARLNKADANLADEFDFEFSEPPAKDTGRRSKHDERWLAARTLTMKNPGQPLKVLVYNQPSQPYNVAKQINNGEHRHFKNDSDQFTAVAGKISDDQYGIWLTYNGEKVTE